MDYRQLARDALASAREAEAMCSAVNDRLAQMTGHLAEVDNCRAVNLMAMRVLHREWLTMRAEIERVAETAPEPEAGRLRAAVAESLDRILTEIGTGQVKH